MNSRIIDSVLKDARNKKANSTVAFLDVTSAFDTVGHQHIIQVLKAKGISGDLLNLVFSMLCHNALTIGTGPKKSGSIEIRRGVPQGGPLSPTLFNLSIDHLYREICDSDLANHFGYRLEVSEHPIILTGFADDQAIMACNS